jgi:AhpD family alkylhydroperoxidase
MSYDPGTFNSHAASFHALAPLASKAFAQLHQVTLAQGALTVSVKELIALAISVATGCDDCCGHHLERALSQGASREQIGETLSVAVLMGGGRAYTYAGKVASALEATS